MVMFWVALLLGWIIYAGSISAFCAFNEMENCFTWPDGIGEPIGYFDILMDFMLPLFKAATLDL